jgi:acyl-coenzyme A synthetase/AMP-(fatty) acid ligase
MPLHDEPAIAALFETIAQEAPDRPALVMAETVYSYGMLLALAKAFAIKLAAAGVDSSATIQLETRDLPVVMASLLASAALGARLAENAVVGELLGARPVTHRLFTAPPAQPTASGQTVLIDASWSPAEVLPQADTRFARTQGATDAPWLLLATSGTTGLPKVVGLSQRLVLRRSMAVSDEFVAGKTRFASLFSYDCRPFFARAMAALLNGATIVDRGDWPFWIASGVNRVSGSLKQVKSLVIDGDADRKIAVVEVSGAKISEAEALNLLRYFDLVDDTYGATETSKSFSNLLSRAADGTLRKTGAPRDSLIEIVDADGKPVGPMQTGEIRVRNSYCVTAYLFNQSGEMAALKDGYFYPGDIGRFAENGTLEIIARAGRDVLNFDGVKLNAGVVDHLLASVEGIIAAAAFQSPKADRNEVIAFAQFEEGSNRIQLAELARKACADALGAKITPARVWPITAIPRKADGTPDRAQCAALILEALAASPTLPVSNV